MKPVVFYVKHLSMLRAWVDPVAPFIAGSGREIVVLHASRLNYDTSKAEVAPPPYRTVELSDMSMDAIISLLRELDPAILVLFTFRSLFDLLLVRVARQVGLKTLYVQHGFYVSTRFQMADKRASVRRYATFLKWYSSFLLGKDVARRDELNTIYNSMFRIDYTKTKFDYALFYSPNGYRDANRFFDFASDRVYYSGYPIAKTKQQFESLVGGNGRQHRRIALYIHQPFVIDRFTHLDHQGEFEYLRGMADACKAQDFELVIKIHPRESVERYRDALADVARVDIETPMPDVLRESSVVIGHFSTALFTGVLLRKPIIVMNYPGLDDDYYRFFDDVGLRVGNMQALGETLSDESRYAGRLERFDNFASEYIGGNNSYEHRANTILDIVERATHPS